jgi:heme/copper-type cytochrome/quinol oxidase subunit 4
MKHILWVAGLAALGVTIYYFIKFYESPEGRGTNYAWISAIFFLISIICGAAFFFIKFREEGNQDISITKL